MGDYFSDYNIGYVEIEEKDLGQDERVGRGD